MYDGTVLKVKNNNDNKKKTCFVSHGRQTSLLLFPRADEKGKRYAAKERQIKSQHEAHAALFGSPCARRTGQMAFDCLHT